MHVRTQLRVRAGEILQDHVTGLAGAVQVSRIYVLDNLPAITVYTGEEAADPEETKGHLQYRRLELVVEIAAKENSIVDTVLDDLAEQAEEALATHMPSFTACKRIDLAGTSPEFDDELEKPCGILRQTWEVLYRVDTRAPGVPVE